MSNIENTLSNIIKIITPKLEQSQPQQKEKGLTDIYKSSKSTVVSPFNLFGTLTEKDTKQPIYNLFTVYENLSVIYKNEGLISDSYNLSVIEPFPSTINIKNLLSIHLNISKTDGELIDYLSNKINEMKKKIIMTSKQQQQGLTESYIDSIMIYIYHIGNLLPILSNNKSEFEFKLENHITTVRDNSLSFEYLMMMWLIVSKIYNSNFDNDNDDDRDDEDDEQEETYKRKNNNINICICILTKMIEYVSKMREATYMRFTYIESPSSISNTTMKNNSNNTSLDTIESEQRQREDDVITDNFGNIQGLKARLSILYAKKYEKMFYHTLKKVNINDILNDDEYDLDNKEDEDEEDSDRLSSIKSFSGTAIQISRN